MKIEVVSQKYGLHVIEYDDEDHDLVGPYIWGIRMSKSLPYARTNDYKNRAKGAPGNHIDMHRLIMGFPKKNVDHIDGNTLNNKRSNLRLCSQLENVKNQARKSSNTSGFKGVSWDKKKKKFSCHITVNYKHVFGGYFSESVMAAKRYNELAIQHHGEFARLNNIPK